MSEQAMDGASTSAKWRYRLTAGLLILSTAFLRLLYLANNCPLDLAPDEAHYWDWSRHLDWSYYSKGPLVAWLIRLSCEMFGSWSVALTGSEMLAVRLPAVACGSLLLVALYVLTMQVTRREGLALAVVAVALTLPIIAVGSSLMTIDAPYTCCWAWALVLAHHAVFRRARWAWPVLGLVVGVGILGKYTMVVWPVSLGLFLLVTRDYRRVLLGPGFWTMSAVAAFCCLPILIWNAQNDWVTLRHVNGLAGLSRPASAFHWFGPLALVGTQFALLLGFWFVIWLRAMEAHAPWCRPDAAHGFLWWMSAPMFLIFLVFGFKTGGGEPNWPVTAYVSGMVLTTIWLAGYLESARTWARRSCLAGLAAACGLGLTLTVVIHQSAWTYPLLVKLSGSPTADRPTPLRQFDPTCRLRGWRTLAAEIDRLRLDLRGQGVEPVLAAANWHLPGQLGFYCQGNPRAYSVGLALGGRHSQYDHWRPNPLEDAPQFAGRTFILVSTGPADLSVAFERVETTRTVLHYEAGQPIALWAVIVGHGYRGFPKLTQQIADRPY
jgi:hypothetical protein